MTTTSILGWALVHYIWQGALVAGILALLLALAGRQLPSVRYALSLAALLVMAAVPLATALRLAATDADRDRAFVGAAPSAVDDPGTTKGADLAGADLVGARVVGADVVAADFENGADVADGADNRFDAVLRAWLDHAMPWLVAAWLAGVAALSLRLAGGWARVRRLTRVGTRSAPAALHAAVARLATRLRVGREVQLLESLLIQVPAVVGWLRPVLLVPVSAGTGLTPQQLEVLLAHELAHIWRHDYAVNLLQIGMETLFFYHPAVWWVSRRIREEREHCCDDLAVRATGERRLYAEALIELERVRIMGLELSVAATGGSLMRRIRRLADPTPSHRQGGSPWVAGVALLAAALAIGTGATLSGAGPGGSGPDSLEAQTETGKPQIGKPGWTGRDRAVEQGSELRSTEGTSAERADAKRQGEELQETAAPDTVLLLGDGGALSERWTRATIAARRERFPEFWIGYAVPGDASRGWLYLDRRTPLVISGGSVMSGHLRFRGDIAPVAAPGVRLDGLVGPLASDDLVILVGFGGAAGRGEPVRVHVAHAVFPAHFGGWPLIWLGRALAVESVPLIGRVDAGLSSEALRLDVVAAVGAHSDSRVVVPALIRWVESDEPDGVRAEAVEWLGYHPDPRSLATLARAARRDRSARVRAEAAEAMGDLDLPAAADTLAALATTLPDHDARREAVESLGARREPVALETLVRIAHDDPAADIQRKAVETLGDLDGGRGLAPLLELARSHPRTDVRREAVETIADVAPPSEALAVLEALVRRDPDVDIQRAAVEALGNFHDPAAVERLVRIAESHPHPDVRRAAVEALVEVAPAEEALTLLGRIARDDRDPDVQRAAVEMLGELEAGRALPVLLEIAQRHPRARVQRAAVEALGEMHGHEPQALARVADLARSHPDPSVRRAAIEAYAEHAPADSAAALLVPLARSDGAAQIRRAALEALAELHGGAGIPALIEIAESHPDRRLRLEAIELLGESGDPRAQAALERLVTPR